MNIILWTEDGKAMTWSFNDPVDRDGIHVLSASISYASVALTSTIGIRETEGANSTGHVAAFMHIRLLQSA